MSKDKDKVCHCKGRDEDCPICEGTGIVLFDENIDNLLINSDLKNYESELEEDE